MPRPNEQDNWELQEQYNPRSGNELLDMKHILLRFLQDLFYLMPEDGGDNGKLFHFQPGDEDYQTAEQATGLIITDRSSIDTDTLGVRPAVVVSRGPFASGNTSLNKYLKREGSTGKKTHTDLMTGSFVIQCVSQKGLEAERLAGIVWKALQVYRVHLQKAGFFNIGDNVSVGVEAPAGSLVSGSGSEDYRMVPVTIPVYYQWSWTYAKDAELLSRITMRILHVLRHFNGSLVYPDAIDEDGEVDEESEGVLVTAWSDPSSS